MTEKLRDRTEQLRDDYIVTVCDKCFTACCWRGIFMCDEAHSAGIVDKPVLELRELGREHPSYWRLK